MRASVFALTPFNFTSIAGNLPSAPAMMGNTVVWKVAESQVYSAAVIMEIFEEAGLPDGVINLMFVDGPEAGDVILSASRFRRNTFHGEYRSIQNAVAFDRIESREIPKLSPNCRRNWWKGFCNRSPEY